MLRLIWLLLLPLAPVPVLRDEAPALLAPVLLDVVPPLLVRPPPFLDEADLEEALPFALLLPALVLPVWGDLPVPPLVGFFALSLSPY